jgi:hypothetical protein
MAEERNERCGYEPTLHRRRTTRHRAARASAVPHRSLLDNREIASPLLRCFMLLPPTLSDGLASTLGDDHCVFHNRRIAKDAG